MASLLDTIQNRDDTGRIYAFASASAPHGSLDAFSALVCRWPEKVGPYPDAMTSWVVRQAPGGPQPRVEQGARGTYNDIYRSERGATFVSSFEGFVARSPKDGGSWVRERVAMLLHGIFGLNEDHVYVWGQDAKSKNILRVFNGGGWKDMPSPGYVVALAGKSPSLLYAGGTRGLLARWENGSWTALDLPTEATVSAVRMTTEDEGYATTHAGELFAFSRHGAARILSLPGAMILDVAPFQDALWLAAGERGGIRAMNLKTQKLSWQEAPISAQRLRPFEDRMFVQSATVLSETTDGVEFQSVTLDPFVEETQILRNVAVPKLK